MGIMPSPAFTQMKTNVLIYVKSTVAKVRNVTRMSTIR